MIKLNLKESTKRILTSVAILTGAIIFFYGQVFMAKNSAIKILEPYVKGDVQIEKVINKIQPDSIPVNKLSILRNQYQIIKSKKEHHLMITKLMNAYYFGATLSLAIMTIISGVMLLKITDGGLKVKTDRFKTIFYTILSLTTFFGVLIQILDHKENITVNKATFIAYSSTQLKIYNYLITDGSQSLDKEETAPKSIDEFIAEINQEINFINHVTFGIDHEKIKSANEILNYKP